jgi:hypothetical protein
MRLHKSNEAFSEFAMQHDLNADNELRRTFEQMQEIYIFDEQYKLGFDETCAKLAAIFPNLLALD